ncbi:UDP-glucose 4-epimerase family protein [Pseudomonas sp. 5P_3.1_Bac2]|uniref:UDP-glucose 4-epimerase family protein n=1 Tax=Pseudomonas sp. 5P_3.1_Bac2 TaxID=2971617 RepID=UPI003965B1A8
MLVTGASGFVGGSLLRYLSAQGGYRLHAALRKECPDLPADVRCHQVEGLAPTTDWSQALAGVEVVVHSAARVHVMQEQEQDPLAEYRLANVAGTVQLARQALAAGVRRFIYISSVKVNGEFTESGRAFTAEDTPAPQDPYGVSKWEAELALRELLSGSSMELVIIRPVLIYGPGVKANFLSLLRVVERGVPLPFARVTQRRSLVGIDNLLDLIKLCFDHPAAVGQIFLASDGQDVSLPELLRHIAHAMDKPCRLLPVPLSFMRAGAKILGRGAMAQRLLSSLQVDIRKNQQMLQWTAPVSLEQGVIKTVQAYLEASK